MRCERRRSEGGETRYVLANGIAMAQNAWCEVSSCQNGSCRTCRPMIGCEPPVCKPKDCCGVASASFPKRQPRDARGFTPPGDLPSSESTMITGRVRHYRCCTRAGSAELRRLSHATGAHCSSPAGLRLRASLAEP